MWLEIIELVEVVTTFFPMNVGVMTQNYLRSYKVV